ncbi:MAG: S8 family serine peptidase [Sedimentisphaerales bacterium]|nr:S8 family serine peptidase [Sedimentisphaerales bacterium]NLT77942.1 S8 family serine peptidase [Planctomycetota bacterium]
MVVRCREAAVQKPSALAGVLIVWLAATQGLGAEAVLLKSRRFVPTTGLDGLASVRQDHRSERIHAIVQLDSVPTVEQKATLARSQVRLLSYIPNHAWLASFPLRAAEGIVAIPGVRALAKIEPQDKIDPSLRDGGVNTHSRTTDGAVRLIVTLFEDADVAEAVATSVRLGGQIVGYADAGRAIVLLLPVNGIARLASCDDVKWIDQHYASVDLNDGVRAATNVEAVQEPPYDLSGSGVVVGQWESGHPDANHVDLIGRVMNVDDDGWLGDHATRVAGTLVGDGSLLAGRRYRGMAPAAMLVSFRAWDNVAHLRQQYEQAIDLYGIDISNNSWAKVEWHVYKDYCAALDEIVRGGLGKPVSIVCAAGNEGGWATIVSMAVGKNVITVGATNSDDGSIWSSSNKGPTADGRIKPDLMSPGCEARKGWGVWSTLPGNRYGSGCGTSMAAPSVSGTLALLLEDWRAAYETDPLPSTLKGVLIHTAADLSSPGPDYASGYGSIDAGRAVEFTRANTLDALIIEGRIETPDRQDAYTLEVLPGRGDLKITLVWDDFPADPLAAMALVNDLDLVAIDPAGRRHFPWTLDPGLPGDPARRDREDHTNNVEQVCVADPLEGSWRIVVIGTTVPQCEQTYSLIADGGLKIVE